MSITIDGRRFYATSGKWVPSVTTVLQRTFPGPVAENAEQRAEWDAKRDLGTRVHDLIARGYVARDEWDALPDQEQYGVLAWQRFVYDYRFRRESSELEIVTDDYGGRIDDCGRIPAGRVLVDYKTGRLRKHQWELQLGGYYGLYITQHPRRKLFGALAVQLDCTNGTYSVMSRSHIEMLRLCRAFIEEVKAYKEDEDYANQGPQRG